MKLHWAGEYNLDPASLPHAEPKPNAVPFREAENTKKLAVIANAIALVLLAALAAACGRSGTGTHVLRRSRTAHRRTRAAVFMVFSGFSYAF